jgi:cardiolipin synthase A/B
MHPTGTIGAGHESLSCPKTLPRSRLLTSEYLVFLLLHAVLALLTALHALLYKRDSRAAFGWIGVCLILPVVGPVIYLLFGLNRARGKAQRLGLGRLKVGLDPVQSREQIQPLPDSVRLEFRNLARIGQALSRHQLTEDNDVTVLVNGEEAYPAMLSAIERAKSHVLLCTYLLDRDDTGRQFVQALKAATLRGVEVRVLIDGFGDLYARPRASRTLKQAGIRVARFLPPRLLPPSLSVNMRNHHKILIIDDQIGFTGGMNFGDRHLVKRANNPRPTADLHFRLSGPIVLQLREEFLRMWHFTTGSRQDPPALPVQAAGDLTCRTITDGPDEDLDRLPMLLSAAIAEARESVRIMTPYFLPPRELIGAIQAAAIRGVEVTVVLPEVNNLPYVHWATRNMLWEILIRGVRVVYQPAPFNHAKLFVVDGDYTLIGSANWDPRSLRLNFELQVEVYGADFARTLIDYIDEAAGAGRQVSLEEVDGRGLLERCRDSLCWLFSPYL